MVAELDNKVIGTFHVTYFTYLLGAGREDCQIEKVHVDAKFRGNGIGTFMINGPVIRLNIEAAAESSSQRIKMKRCRPFL
jgi:hypothetical protein